MRFALPLLALAAIAAPVVAQQMAMPTSPPGKADPALAKSGRYKIDPPHSQVVFSIGHLGFTNYVGMFTNPTGTLTLDTRAPANSKVEVTFPIDKVVTTVPELDAHLKKSDFFDIAKYPTATFISTRVEKTGVATATITGNLTMHGVTKPVTLRARFVGAGNEFWGDKKSALGFTATTSVKRSDFGIASSMPPLISDNVDLTINAGFEAE